MYWDVVEVKPEPDYRLFVRFRDGLTGHIHLERKNMTGVLSPLADPSFFEQVFIDSGAVAWPGEIDLAPDAMYATVATDCWTLPPHAMAGMTLSPATALNSPLGTKAVLFFVFFPSGVLVSERFVGIGTSASPLAGSRPACG